jgi:hypothetical protein
MIVIGVDLHKRSFSAVAVDEVGRQLDALETLDGEELTYVHLASRPDTETDWLEKDAKSRFARAAAPDQIGRFVEIDLYPRRQHHCLGRLITRAGKPLKPPAQDLLCLDLVKLLELSRNHGLPSSEVSFRSDLPRECQPIDNPT